MTPPAGSSPADLTAMFRQRQQQQDNAQQVQAAQLAAQNEAHRKALLWLGGQAFGA